MNTRSPLSSVPVRIVSGGADEPDTPKRMARFLNGRAGNRDVRVVAPIECRRAPLLREEDARRDDERSVAVVEVLAVGVEAGQRQPAVPHEARSGRGRTAGAAAHHDHDRTTATIHHHHAAARPPAGPPVGGSGPRFRFIDALTVCCRPKASLVARTTLAKLGSGRSPSIGVLRLRPVRSA